MFFRLLQESPVFAVMFLVFIVVSLTVHEYSHARTAFQLGDPTAERMGRLSLNPARHLDPAGSLVFLLAGFGWAKPVPVDVARIGRQGMMWVALAGPVSNLIMATIVGLVIRSGFLSYLPFGELFVALAGLFVSLNVTLAIFNLLPIAPLDGSRVLMGLAPEEWAYKIAQFEQYGMMVLFGLIILGNVAGFSILGTIMDPPIQFLYHLIVGSG